MESCEPYDGCGSEALIPYVKPVVLLLSYTTLYLDCLNPSAIPYGSCMEWCVNGVSVVVIERRFSDSGQAVQFGDCFGAFHGNSLQCR